MRHAQAERERVLGDAGRALTPIGLAQARRTATWLAATGVRAVDLALVSPAVRTDQTWRVVAGEVTAGRVRVVDELYATSAQGLVALLAEVGDDVRAVLVVGHEPVLARTAAALADEASAPLAARVAAGMGVASAAVLELALPWSALAAGTCALVALSPTG